MNIDLAVHSVVGVKVVRTDWGKEVHGSPYTQYDLQIYCEEKGVVVRGPRMVLYTDRPQPLFGMSEDHQPGARLTKSFGLQEDGPHALRED